MAESDDEIYQRHFEMESDRIREERIKAKAVADARKANRTKKQIKRDEERKERKARQARELEELARKRKEDQERDARSERRWRNALLISLGLMIACFGLFGLSFFFLPEIEWVHDLLLLVGLLSLAVLFLICLAFAYDPHEKWWYED